jgi:hypothetical protein
MKNRNSLRSNQREWLRRDFIKVGSLSLLGMNLSQSLLLESAVAAATGRQPRGKARSVILVWLEGGPSQKDTFDPKPDSAFRPIATNVSGIQISELFPRLAKRMDRLSIIRSMKGFGDDHPEATHYSVTGHNPNPSMKFPFWGSILAKEMGATNKLPPYVLVPTFDNRPHYQDYFRAAFLEPEYEPLSVPDPSREDFDLPDLSLPKSLAPAAISERLEFRRIVDQSYRERSASLEHAKLDAFTQKAWEMILAPEVRRAFDLSQEPEKLKDDYGRSSVGQSLLLARRLVESGVRFVTAAGYHYSNWDTHYFNDDGHRDKLCPPLDQGLSTLLDDLVARGLHDETVVVVMGEFGRTPFYNASGGRDHWPRCWTALVGGGGVQCGRVVGASDVHGGEIIERRVMVGDLFATVYKAFGVDWTKEYMTPIGRPIKIANSIDDTTGEPVDELL